MRHFVIDADAVAAASLTKPGIVAATAEYGDRMVGAIRLSAIAIVMATLALTGCATIGLDDGTCVVPLVRVAPATAHPGDTITVVSDDSCDVEVPNGGWVVVAGHVGGGKTLVQVTAKNVFDGQFRVELTLSEDFPVGEAYAGIENWDYSTCPDNASCASPTGSFTVEP